jgi:hypothetical protein
VVILRRLVLSWLSAFAWPTLEVFFTSCPTTLVKKKDEETDLFLFELNT